MENKFLVPSSIVLAGVVIAGAIVYTRLPHIPLPPSDAGEASLRLEGASLDTLKVRKDDFVLGNPAAPVVAVEYGDFQCPFCARFFSATESQLRKTYIKEGTVALVWRDFAFLGEESMRAAEAARCAGEQGKFWEYHDILFLRQAGENQGAFNDTALLGFAKEIGLKQDTFAACMSSKKYRQKIIVSAQEGKALGVSGTPTTFVNGQLINGAVLFDTFKNAIEQELKN